MLIVFHRLVNLSSVNRNPKRMFASQRRWFLKVNASPRCSVVRVFAVTVTMFLMNQGTFNDVVAGYDIVKLSAVPFTINPLGATLWPIQSTS